MHECSEQDCDTKEHSRGLCQKHYLRWWRNAPNKPTSIADCRTTRKEVLTYKGIHNRLRREIGPASLFDCASCVGPAESWAFIKEWCPPEQVQVEVRTIINREFDCSYSSEPAHYLTLCNSCHGKLDQGLLNV